MPVSASVSDFGYIPFIKSSMLWFRSSTNSTSLNYFSYILCLFFMRHVHNIFVMQHVPANAVWGIEFQIPVALFHVETSCSLGIEEVEDCFMTLSYRQLYLILTFSHLLPWIWSSGRSGRGAEAPLKWAIERETVNVRTTSTDTSSSSWTWAVCIEQMSASVKEIRWGTSPECMKGTSQCLWSLSIMTFLARKLYIQKLGVGRSLPRNTPSSTRSS